MLTVNEIEKSLEVINNEILESTGVNENLKLAEAKREEFYLSLPEDIVLYKIDLGLGQAIYIHELEKYMGEGLLVAKTKLSQDETYKELSYKKVVRTEKGLLGQMRRIVQTAIEYKPKTEKSNIEKIQDELTAMLMPR